MSSEFVNRKREFIEIKEWIDSDKGINKGMFVYAASGIGKSRFVSELFESGYQTYTKIKVQVLGDGSGANGSYAFLSRLYLEIIKVTEKSSVLPLSERIEFDGVSISDIAGIGISIRDKRGYADNVKHMLTYLKRKLVDSTTPYIIDFENFNLVDSESLECLRYLFTLGKGHRFIFEFTIDSLASMSGLPRQISQLSDYLECQVFELKKLQLKDISILCERNSLPFESAREIYEDLDGNLFQLLMLRYTKNIQSHAPLQDTLLELNDDAKLILFLIELCKGECTIKLVKGVFSCGKQLLAGNQKYSESYIISQLLSLQDKELVSIGDGVIRICHDQLLNQIESERHSPLYYLAGSLFENYHYTQLRSIASEDSEYHTLSLLHMYSIFGDSKILSILPELTRIILRQHPQRIIEKIEEIRNQLELSNENSNILDELTRYVADVCIAVGQWQAAYKNIVGYYSDDVPWQACYLAAVISANPQISDAENKLLKIREKYKTNIMPYMSISVSLFSYYMRVMPEPKVKNIGENLLREFVGYRNLNYAFLLKNYSNTLGNTEALKTLKVCDKIFKAYNRTDLVAMNKITIASRLIYAGRLDDGLNLLNNTESEMLRLGIPIRQHYFFCNRAAAHLLRGDYGEQDENELNTALSLSDSVFEKAIILCNLMIYYLLSSKHLDASNILRCLKSLDISMYNNIDLTLIMRQNFLFYYESMGMSTHAIQAKNSLVELAFSEDCPLDIKKQILGYFPKEYPEFATSKKTFMARFRYHPDFIGYWQYEICYEFSGKSHLTTLSEFPDIMSFGP